MNYWIHSFILLLLSLGGTIGIAKSTSFEKAAPFIPDIEKFHSAPIEWGYFTVPEDWDNPSGKKIKLAVALLKSTSGEKSNDPLVVIDGGPGAGSIEGLWHWLNHPLRAKRDIILVDARGTGFSEPRLCPELGQKFFHILARDQTPQEDEAAKAKAALSCKQQLIGKGIDIRAYHSAHMAKDLHALKQYLGYTQWNVCSVSYGTYVAQVYLTHFPDDFRTLILDSPISEMDKFYTRNTTNYQRSLDRVFAACQKDPNCNREYPQLESKYYEVIKKLQQQPITVEVDPELIPSGTFTYNTEDFKIAIHQALYQKELVEVLPLLIYQFHHGNKAPLSALVTAFSSALGLDYGHYYCVSCIEALPNNALAEYHQDAASHAKLGGGVSFYGSDFAVCSQWNNDSGYAFQKDSLMDSYSVPMLIITGAFDPITPMENGLFLKRKSQNTHLVNATSFGHAASFTFYGLALVDDFVNKPDQAPNVPEAYTAPLKFVNHIVVNGGVARLGESIDQFDIIFFSPFIIALLVSLVAVFAYLWAMVKKHPMGFSEKVTKWLLSINSLVGIAVVIGAVYSLNEVAAGNFYILAFGLPQQYRFLFHLLMVFVVLVAFTSVYFVVSLRKVQERSILFSVLFSNLVIVAYFIYWGFLPI